MKPPNHDVSSMSRLETGRLSRRWKVVVALGAMLMAVVLLSILHTNGHSANMEQLLLFVVCLVTAFGSGFSVGSIRAQQPLQSASAGTNQALNHPSRKRGEPPQHLEAKRPEAELYVATARMAGRVAHEINNPLGTIKNASLLLRKFGPNADGSEKWFNLLDSEVERIASIVRQMYSLYSPTEGSVTESHLEHLVKDITLLVEPRFTRHGVKLTTSVSHPATSFPTLENMVKQVLLSLLYNSLEASSPGQIVELEVLVSDDELRFEVKDTGVGVPESVMPHLFEPFVTTKRSQGGSSGVGLGLSVSRSLARALGGELTFISSVPWIETVFRFTIPRSVDCSASFSPTK